MWPAVGDVTLCVVIAVRTLVVVLKLATTVPVNADALGGVSLAPLRVPLKPASKVIVKLHELDPNVILNVCAPVARGVPVPCIVTFCTPVDKAPVPEKLTPLTVF